jgi:hypothetical protein
MEVTQGQKINTCADTHCSVTIIGENTEVESLPVGIDEAVGSTFVMSSVGYNYQDANPRLRRLLGFLDHGAYG